MISIYLHGFDTWWHVLNFEAATLCGLVTPVTLVDTPQKRCGAAVETGFGKEHQAPPNWSNWLLNRHVPTIYLDHFGSIWGVGLPIFRHIWVFFGDHPPGTSEWWQKGRWIWYLKMWLKTWNLFETLPLGVDTSLGITLWMLNPDLCFNFVSIILYIYTDVRYGSTCSSSAFNMFRGVLRLTSAKFGNGSKATIRSQPATVLCSDLRMFFLRVAGMVDGLWQCKETADWKMIYL